jgi:hypothetical protein
MPDLTPAERRALLLNYQQLNFQLNRRVRAMTQYRNNIIAIRKVLRRIESLLNVSDTPESRQHYDFDEINE